MSIFEDYLEDHVKSQIEYLTFEEYLELCKEDPLAYATPAERMMKAIGVPVKLSDTPGSVRSGAPLLGEHTEEVIAEWVMPSKE